MIGENELLGKFVELRHETLEIWISRGWVAPARSRNGFRYREIDVARVGLIYEFTVELDLAEETIDVVLPLIDQIHGLRNQLHRLATAIDTQPAAVRQKIVQTLEKTAR